MVVAENAQSAKQIPELHTRIPNAYSATAVATPTNTGQKNCCATLINVDRRHASSGPMPVSVRRVRPIGSIHLLKNGGPTVRRSPRSASLSVGNIVANRTKNAENNRIQLLARNAASRDIHESSSLRAFSSGRR